MALDFQENVPLSKYTSLAIGGPAKLFVEVKTEEELVEALTEAINRNLPFLVIGGGSNLLVSDEGFDGLVIKDSVSGITTSSDNKLEVFAGTPLDDLVEYTITYGLDGMSTMKGIPGTVGGAVYGSAGAYGDNIRDYLEEILCFDTSTQDIVSIDKDGYVTGYRDNILKRQKNLIVLKVVFSGFPSMSPEALKIESEKILQVRSEKYPPETLCPGSFFKNIPMDNLLPEQIEKVNAKFREFGKDPEHLNRFGKIPVGPLIEVLGGNGDKLGQIQISQNHGNTFFNQGDGTAKDFWELAHKWYLKVKEEFDITLEPEVQFVNLASF
jgi:UDP-N-acetylmuramate dehydrogenase